MYNLRNACIINAGNSTQLRVGLMYYVVQSFPLALHILQSQLSESELCITYAVGIQQLFVLKCIRRPFIW